MFLQRELCEVQVMSHESASVVAADYESENVRIWGCGVRKKIEIPAIGWNNVGQQDHYSN